MNERALKFLMRRDASGGRVICPYCREQVEMRKKGGLMCVLDHLDNNPRNNQYSNLVLCHQKCNQRKRTYIDYQLVAQECLRRNAAYVPDVGGQVAADDRENENVVNSQKISKFVEDWLEINCPPGPILDFNESVKTISYLCRQRFAMGAPDTIKRHLGVMTSGPAPWALTDVGGRRMISRRVEAGGDDDDE